MRGATAVLNSSNPIVTRRRVGLLLIAVGDLSGSGGTERQFADLFEFLRRDSPTVQLVTSAASLGRLRQAGRLASADGLVVLRLGAGPHGKLAAAWLAVALTWLSLRYRWDIVQICQPTPLYVPFAALLSRLPRWLRPRVVLTVVDCTVAHHLPSPDPPADPYERQVVAAHRWYFRWVRLDGIYTWYAAFADVAERLSLAPAATIRAAACCFARVERFVPGPKRPVVVFAGRLSAQKRPLLFVDAVASLLRRHPVLAESWSFQMYGAGPLEAAVRARIASHGLDRRVTLSKSADLAPVLAASRLFVSTQAYENFTSLAMLEAMAAGNAVIAHDVGQTRAFVRDGENGRLVAAAAADAFAEAMADYLQHPDRHDAMAAASRRIATTEHTVERFAADLAAFWDAVCSRARSAGP